MRMIDLSALAADPHAEHVIMPCERIGTTNDGRPVYRRVDGWEPTTAYALSTHGNWVEARVEAARHPVELGVDPLGEVAEA